MTATASFNNFKFSETKARMAPYRPSPPSSERLNARFVAFKTDGVRKFTDGEQPYVMFVFEIMDGPNEGRAVFSDSYLLNQSPDDTSISEKAREARQRSHGEFKGNVLAMLGPDWANADFSDVEAALHTLAEQRQAFQIRYSTSVNKKKPEYPYVNLVVEQALEG